MGVHYFKTCDKCGKVLVENCLDTSTNPYADYAVVSLKIMSKGKAYKQPTVYLCKDCYSQAAIPKLGDAPRVVDDNE